MTTSETSHSARYWIALLLLVSVGRLPELFPALSSLALGKVSTLVALIVVLLSRQSKSVFVLRTAIGRRMTVFTVVAVLSILVSVWKSQTLQFLFENFLTNIILFYLIHKTTYSVQTVRFYVNALIVAIAVMAILTLQLQQTGRLSVSETYDPNDLAMVIVTVLPLMALSVLASRGIARLVFLAALGTSVAAVMFTGSRGGFIGLIIIGVYLLLSRLPDGKGGRSGRWNPGKLMLFAVMAVTITTITPATTWERMSTLSDIKDDYNVTADTGRLALWGRGIESILNRPIGSGMATFEVVEGMGGGRYKSAHNTLIQVATELGILGFSVFMSLYFLSFKILRQVDAYPMSGAGGQLSSPDSRNWTLAYTSGLRAALVGFFVTTFFLSAAYTPVLYVLLGLIGGMEECGHRNGAGSGTETGQLAK
ncbi:MAG: hypothetical protein A2W25_11585 [candidate division Zixibacteria bacterium RBG_16_53_22]|nr:MAG: hypothetical protein A2W25_11585 [candidate division Zixibacteria bacterium RBG_16_53_22]